MRMDINEIDFKKLYTSFDLQSRSNVAQDLRASSLQIQYADQFEPIELKDVVKMYETPAGTVVKVAHQALESICLDKYTMHYKDFVAVKYAELVYNGMWFSQLREALDAFVTVTQQQVTGTIRLKLFKGNVIIAGRKSPYSLYREDYASFGEDDVYNQQDANGFIQLFGLPLKVEAMLAIDGSGESRYRKPDYSKFKRD